MRSGMFHVNNHIIQRHASGTLRHCFMSDDRTCGIVQAGDSTSRNSQSILESLAMLKNGLKTF